MKSTIKYYRGICSGLHSHLYFMGGIFTERGIDFMTAEEYRALLDTDFSDVKINEILSCWSEWYDWKETAEVYKKSWKSLYDESGEDES